jgi:hypothetical protein
MHTTASLSLMLSALSSLSLSCIDLQRSGFSSSSVAADGQNDAVVAADVKRRRKRASARTRKRTTTIFYLEEEEEERNEDAMREIIRARAWTTTRAVRAPSDVFKKIGAISTAFERIGCAAVEKKVKQRVSKEDVFVSTVNSPSTGDAVETFERASSSEDFRTMVELVLHRRKNREEETSAGEEIRADERTVASVVKHALAMLTRESDFDRLGMEDEEGRCGIDVVLKGDGRTLTTIEGEGWNEDEDDDDGEIDGEMPHMPRDIVARANFKECEVTLVFSRTKEAELRVGNDTRGTASSWIREEENAGKKDIRVKKMFSLNPAPIGSEESKALDVLFHLPSHFWSKFGFHPIHRLRRQGQNQEEDGDDEGEDIDEKQNDKSYIRAFETPSFGLYVYDQDSDDEVDDDDDDSGRATAARDEQDDDGGADGADLEEEMELLDLRKQVRELPPPDLAEMKTNEEEMDAHNIQHLQDLFLRDVCVVWRRSKEKKKKKNSTEEAETQEQQQQRSASPSVAERFRTCFEKAFMEAKRKNRPNFTSKRERREWRIGERIMRNAANIYRNAVVNKDLMFDVAKADENIKDWEGKICTLLCQKRAFGQMPR